MERGGGGGGGGGGWWGQTDRERKREEINTELNYMDIHVRTQII